MTATRAALPDQRSLEDPADGYRALSAPAIVGCALGLLSPVVYFGLPLVFIPILAMAVSGWALWRVTRRPDLYLGKTAALVGLTLGLVSASAVTSYWAAEEFTYRRTARTFAQLWFDYLRDGKPEKAYLLSLETYSRPRLSDDRIVWERYRLEPKHADALRRFCRQPVVRALLELGPRAQVRRYETIRRLSGTLGDRRQVKSLSEVYAVTYEDQGQRKSFLITTYVSRTKYPNRPLLDWQFLEFSFGRNP